MGFGHNKRHGGRSLHVGGDVRQGGDPLTRSYESNGPDVKIRGSSRQVGERYLILARDAHASGDSVRAESLLQHAEHYFRLVASAQRAKLTGRVDDVADADDLAADTDRFASPPEPSAPVRPPRSGGEARPLDAPTSVRGADAGRERRRPEQPHGGGIGQGRSRGERTEGRGRRGVDGTGAVSDGG